MSLPEATIELPDELPQRPRWRARRSRTPIALAVAVIVVAVGVVLLAVSGNHAPASTNADATSLATVTEQPLSSQTLVSATLGYAGNYAVADQTPGTITDVPALGASVREGQGLYQLGGSWLALLYGPVPAYRSLSEGMSGSDVRELNAALVALGDATSLQLDPSSTYFSSSTAAALERLQAQLALPQTGNLPLGQAVFLPTAARVTELAAVEGYPLQPGSPGLQASSTKRQVVIALDATQQADVRVGDRVTITLPDNSTTPGVVSAVGTVATGSSSASAGAGSESTPGAGGSGATPTINVDVTPTDPAATGQLDQAPVEVTITTASVNHALVVPLDALLAEAGGTYAVEVAGQNGTRHLVPVSLGLFDDADGLVQVTSSGLTAGQRVVVPSL